MLLGFPLFGWGILRWLDSSPRPGDSTNVSWSERKKRELDGNGLEMVIMATAGGGGLVLYAVTQVLS